MNTFRKILGKLKSGSWFPFYNSFYKYGRIDGRKILLQSGFGKGMDSNIFALLGSLSSEEGQDFTIRLCVHKDFWRGMQQKLRQAGFLHVSLVKMGSLRYYYDLSTAKYLITDATFPGRFVKKDGQRMLNVWHGTPLKKMGRDNMAERGLMGNVMRQLLQSDYLLFPNRFMEEAMGGAYCLDQLFRGCVLHTGYPRNDVFFHSRSGDGLKRDLGFEGIKLYLYMPTYRGRSDQADREGDLADLKSHLQVFDRLLDEDEVLLVKLHTFEETAVDFTSYRRIAALPGPFDPYEVLSACDGLATDYSSVMFDFACTGRPVVLFTYDLPEYLASRGTYIRPESLPFHLVTRPEEVIEKLRLPVSYLNQKDYRERFMTWENGHGCQDALDALLFDRIHCECGSGWGKEDKAVLFYAGDLAKNGITSAAVNLLNQYDFSGFRPFVSFRMNSVSADFSRVDAIPARMGLFPLASEMNMDPLTGLANLLYLKKGIRSSWIKKRLREAYQREWTKHFGGTQFSHILHFNGYEDYMIALFLFGCPEGCRRTIWAHSDMVKEIEVRKNVSPFLLADAYHAFDYVAAVSEGAAASVEALMGDERKKVRLIPNFQDPLGVRRRAFEELVFDADTKSDFSCERVREILSLGDPVFISIGRFSEEKAFDRLLEAFEGLILQIRQAGENEPVEGMEVPGPRALGGRWAGAEPWLVIIGGAGPLFDEHRRQAALLHAADHIILIRSLKNPMPILAASSLFISSSVYEGSPIVLYEAAFLGIPRLCTDIPGNRALIEKLGGVLVPSDPEGAGLTQGMMRFLAGENMGSYCDIDRINVIPEEKLRKLLLGSGE